MNHVQHTHLQRTLIASLVGALAAGSAFAQQAAPSTAKKEIQEVIVTAQKRPESASKTPVSLTALSGDELILRGVKTAEDLTNVVPNVQIGVSDAGNTNIYIRGIGSNNAGEVGDPAAAFHVDGVYLARPDQARNAFMDVERVEVLRGPQGTLYGRNATAGAINVITAKPGKEFGAKGSVEIGSFDLKRAEAMLNVPVNDKVAIRAALLTKKENNYIETPRASKNSTSTMSGRVHALFDIAPGFSWLVTADSTHIDGPESAGVPLPLAASKGVAGRTNSTVLRADGDAKYTGLTSELSYSFGPAALTYIASKHKRTVGWERNLITPMAPTGSENRAETTSDQMSHELRIASVGTGPLRWVAGLFWYDEKMHSDAAFSDGFIKFKLGDLQSDSQAAFGQMTYSIASNLRLTGGLRTTRDEKSCTDCSQSIAVFNADFTAKRDWSKTDWKIGLDYDLNKTSMIYAVAGTGYKAGGFNNAAPAVPFFNQPAAPVHYYDPEILTSIEVGIKKSFWGNRARMTAALFHYDYKDLQVSTLIPIGGGLTTGGVDNAARAKVNGFEAETRMRVGSDGTFNASLAITDAKYGTYTTCTNEFTGARMDCSGKSLRNAPKTTFSLGYEHNTELAGGTLRLRVDTRYSSKYYNDDANSDGFRQKAYTRTGLSARWDAPNDKWFISAYARNLENKNVVNSRLSNTVFGAFGYTAAPRTIGLSIGTEI